MGDDQTGNENPHSITSPGHTGALALSNSEEAEALGGSVSVRKRSVGPGRH